MRTRFPASGRGLDGRRARLIVVALGSNDVGATDFSTRYLAALEHLKPYADAMLLVNIRLRASPRRPVYRANSKLS